MKQLSKTSVILKRFGITTREYREYSHKMQMALDASHLDVHDFTGKYLGEIMKALGFMPDDYTWYEEIKCCMRMCSIYVCTFADAYKFYQEDYNYFCENVRRN